MNKEVFFARPNHDDVVAYLFYYSKELVSEAGDKGFKVINKEKEDVTKKIVSSILKKKKPSFVMFNGHGNKNIICGHNDEILIKVGENEKLLKNKIIYSLSCSSAAELGKSVANEKTTFIGYCEEFALGMDKNSQVVIQRDKRAKLFLEPSNLLVKSILKCNVVSEAVKKAKMMMKNNISILRTDPFPEAKDYVPFLFNNYAVLEVLGNENVSL